MISLQNEVSYFVNHSSSLFVTDFLLAGFAAERPPVPTIGYSLLPICLAPSWRPNLAPSSPQPPGSNLASVLVLQKPPDHPWSPFSRVQLGVSIQGPFLRGGVLATSFLWQRIQCSCEGRSWTVKKGLHWLKEGLGQVACALCQQNWQVMSSSWTHEDFSTKGSTQQYQNWNIPANRNRNIPTLPV